MLRLFSIMCVYLIVCNKLLFVHYPGSGFPMPMPDNMTQPPGYAQYPSSSTPYGGSGFSGYPASSGYMSYPSQGYSSQYPPSTSMYGGGSNLPYPQYTSPGTTSTGTVLHKQSNTCSESSYSINSQTLVLSHCTPLTVKHLLA